MLWFHSFLKGYPTHAYKNKPADKHTHSWEIEQVSVNLYIVVKFSVSCNRVVSVITFKTKNSVITSFNWNKTKEKKIKVPS